MTNKNRLNVLIGVSGGIAAYKIPFLIRLLKKEGMGVQVILTENSRSLVGVDALRTVSENPVYYDSCSDIHDMNHIRLAEWADVFVIVPATANTIAKIAHGIADNLLSTLVLSFAGPLLIAPAMNTEMWNNKATQENLVTLTRRNITVLPVGSGELACGVVGPGRLIDLNTIVEYIHHSQAPRTLKGKRVLISSGPTTEFIDPVRVITNMSTGKMGAALAGAALARGAEVIVVSGKSDVSPPEGVTIIPVLTSAEMQYALEQEFASCDICIMAAAVSDYRPQNRSDKKLKRSETGDLLLSLTPNADIAASLGRQKDKQLLVGFALETEPDETLAKEKMIRKNCDMIVFNSVNTSLGLSTSAITIITQNRDSQKYESQSKRHCAATIFDHIEQIMEH